MFNRLESITRNILMFIILFSILENFFELTWINRKSPYYFGPILLLAVSNIMIQIINFFRAKKNKRDGSIET
jgi:hypothetical protein